MFNKMPKSVQVICLAVSICAAYLFLPVISYAAAPCSDGASYCGEIVPYTMIASCTASSHTNGSTGETCNDTESLPTGSYQVGQYTEEIFSSSGYIQAGNFDDYGYATLNNVTIHQRSVPTNSCLPVAGAIGYTSITIPAGDTAYVTATNSCANNDPHGTPQSVAGTSLSVTTTAIDCYTDATNAIPAGHAAGSYVPTDTNGVLSCTFVPLKSPAPTYPLAGINVVANNGVNTITLTPGQTSVTIPFTFSNPVAGSQVNVTSSGCSASVSGGGLNNTDVSLPLSCTPGNY